MTQATICIPVGPAHAEAAHRAADSVAAQTVACDLLMVHDVDGRGPAWARNKMLAQVATEYVIFLDADDTIAATFAEECLAASDGRHYIYTDWHEGARHVTAPAKPWCGGTWHVVTTLIPTAWARAVGGFDEALPGAEDTDFYLKLTTSGRCGLHLPRALFQYAPGGGRAARFRDSSDYHQVMELLTKRYGGRMGCCGSEIAAPPTGGRQPGDVLALALWRGNRSQAGPITGRLYSYISWPGTEWVDPRDVAARPNLWQRLTAAAEALDMSALAALIHGAPIYEQPPAAPIVPDVPGLLARWNARA